MPAAPRYVIRDCLPSDAETIVNLVHELAVYEKLEAFATGTPEAFRQHLFGANPPAEAILAEADGVPVGFALFFTTFSTFRAQPGIYLEDLYVKPEHRGRGVGKRLIATVARKAVERGSGRMEWAVLNWNTPSIQFYESLGARPLDEWTTYRLADEPLTRLAAQADATAEKGSA